MHALTEFEQLSMKAFHAPSTARMELAIKNNITDRYLLVLRKSH